MEVDVDELSHDCPNNFDLTLVISTIRVKVELSHDHVDVVEVGNGQRLENWKLATFTVDLEDDMLLSQSSVLD